ncbi:F-box domain-containing protein [Pleurotus pulmonarius]
MASLEQPMIAPSFFSSSPNLGEVDAKIQGFKHQIDLLQGEIRRLEEYKNTRLLVVSKLPPEVLSMIFESLALDTTPRSYYARDAYKHLLPATQVCRAWRQVALDSPRIWSCIFAFASPRIVELFLERAKSAPLYLMAPGYYSQELVLLAVLNRHDQLKEIDMDCKPEWAKRVVSESTPQLEVISLRNASYSSFDALQFLAEACPVLKHLSLTGYTLHTRTTSFTTLRSLIIKSGRCDGDFTRTDTVDLFTMLNDLTLLSSLTLIDVLAPLGGPVLPLSVDLPSLTNLFIQDSDISNLGMMSCITAPLIKTIKLIHSGRADAEIVTPVVAAIYSKLPSVPQSNTTFMLHATQYSDTYAHVKMWAGSSYEERESSTPFFDLKVSGRAGDLRAEEVVLTLCPSNGVPPILHLYSDVESFNDDSLDKQRERILRQLKDVTELHSFRLMDITLVLCDTPGKRKQAKSLPSLKTIVLHGSRGIKYKQRILTRLIKQLEARKAVGARVESWLLRPNQLSADDIEKFEGIIDIDIVEDEVAQFE